MAKMSIRNPKLRIFVVFLSIIAVYNLFFYGVIYVWPPRKLQYATESLPPVELDYVVVHIDLKGAPPKLEYLLSLLPMFKDKGVNGLLMEYEDMFPYEGSIVNLSARNCYVRLQLKNFVTTAVNLGIEVIPLIQTFGHLEYALKLEEFKHLRENPAHPDSICPSNKESKLLVTNMLEQMVQFHTDIAPLKHIHVGCDEVFEMNSCQLCKKDGISKEVRFSNYVRSISRLVNNLSPKTTILIWDDMLRNIPPHKWNQINIDRNVEPVYWHYAELDKFPHVNFMKYQKKFKNTWIATAFKGADGKTAVVPNFKKRLVNHFDWMTHLKKAKIPGQNKVYHFKGIVLTGWSRYSHMEPICELLPVSISSLIINLRMIQMFKSSDYSIDDIDELFSKYLCNSDTHLSCTHRYVLFPSFQFNTTFSFNGQKLSELLNRHIREKKIANEFLHNDETSALEYYSQYKYVNYIGLTRLINQCADSLTKIQSVEKEIAFAMKEYYEDDVINEYIGYKSNNLKKNLAHLMRRLKTRLLFNGT